MKIECESKEMLVLELSSTDLLKMDTTYTEMCKSNETLNTVVGKLLCSSLLSEHKGEECKISAFPDTDGGIMLFFDFRSADSLCVFETDDVSALLDCAVALKSSKIRFSDLYTFNGKYRLVLYGAHCHSPAAYEFMQFVGEKAAAEETRQSRTPLCLNNFIDILRQGS